MRIKKHSNGNQYLLTEEGMWVRNFTREVVPYVDLNKTYREDDHFLFLTNEVNNARQRYPWIDTERLYHDKIVIVSDGYKFEERHQILGKLPPEIAIIAVNGALAKWKVQSRNPTYYVVNNPYKECLRYLPRRQSLPKCIASTRTNHEFLSLYRGTKFRYAPVNEQQYSGVVTKEIEYQIDDYRNPICAAIGLAYRFGVENLVLFCCDDSFDQERPGAEQLKNGLWMYPQQHIAHGLIDGSLHWLRRSYGPEVIVKDCSNGPYYANAEYINDAQLLQFFGIGVDDDKME